MSEPGRSPWSLVVVSVEDIIADRIGRYASQAYHGGDSAVLRPEMSMAVQSAPVARFAIDDIN